MDQFMHVPPEQVCVAVEPENAQGRGVGKRAVAVEIDAVDALPSRIQQQSDAFFPLAETPFRLFAFGDVDEGEDRADQLSILFHRIRPILGLETGPVGSPHDLVVDVDAFSFSES